MLKIVKYQATGKDGEPIVILSDAELFSRIRRMQEQFDALTRHISDAYAGMPEEDGMAEILEAVAAERKSR